MPQLGFDFTVLLDFSKNDLVVNVPNNFGTGVANNITGIISVKQPDGITKSGSFSSPQIYWDGSDLTDAVTKLRRTTKKTPLKGEYIISVTLKHPDFDDTTLVKRFNSHYEQPTGKIEKEFDVFTPSLFLDDDTIYNSPDFVIDTISREWNISIGSVGNKVSTDKHVDLIHSGQYYDARYVAVLKVDVVLVPTNGSYSYLRIQDHLEYGEIAYANTPAPYNELLSMLNAIKEKEDGGCSPDPGCGCEGGNGGFNRALSLFNFIKERICGFDTIELYSSIEEFLSIYYDSVPGYENTNQVIQAYDRSFCNMDPDNPDDENSGLPDDIEFYVGEPGAPVAGTDTYTNIALKNWNIRLIIQRVQQTQKDVSPETWFSKPKASDTITLYNQEFEDGTLIQIQFVSGIKGATPGAGTGNVQSNWAQNNPAADDYIKNKPTAFPPLAHMHGIGEIVGLTSALAGKSAVGHTHAIADVSGLSAALSGKAPVVHAHAITDVIGLSEALSALTNGFLSDTVDITTNATVDVANIAKLHRVSSATSVDVTLPAIADLSGRKGLFVLETILGNTEMHRLKAAPGELLIYEGIQKNYIWLAPGEYVWLFYSVSGWKVINSNVPFKTIGVPRPVWKLGPNQIALDGSTKIRTRYPRLFEEITSFTNSYIPDAQWNTASVVYLGVTIPKPYRGCWSSGDNSTTFRLPDFRSASVRGLSDFTNAGVVDSSRYYNYSGGFQKGAIEAHRHFSFVNKSYNGTALPAAKGTDLNSSNSPIRVYSKTDSGGRESYWIDADPDEPNIGRTSSYGTNETRVDNIGLIWAVDI